MIAFPHNDVIVCAGFGKHELFCVTCMNLFYYQYICIPIKERIDLDDLSWCRAIFNKLFKGLCQKLNSAQGATMWVTYVMLSHLEWFGICYTGEDERNKRKKSERT